MNLGTIIRSWNKLLCKIPLDVRRVIGYSLLAPMVFVVTFSWVHILLEEKDIVTTVLVAMFFTGLNLIFAGGKG